MALHLSQPTIGWFIAAAFLLTPVTLGAPYRGSKPRQKNGIWIFPVKPTGLMLHLLCIVTGIALCSFAHWVIGIVVLTACGLAWPLPVKADDAGLITGTLIYQTRIDWEAMEEIRDFDSPQGFNGIIFSGKIGDRFVIVRQFHDTQAIADFIMDRLQILHITFDSQHNVKPISIFGDPPANK